MQLFRKILPSWRSRAKVMALAAIAAYDPKGCKNNNNISKHRPRVIQESGIGVVRTTPDGTQLWK